VVSIERTITFSPSGKTVCAEEGTPLAEAARSAGISVEQPCGGKGVCAKCLVRVESGSVEWENNGRLAAALAGRGFVMLCRAKVGRSDASIALLTEFSGEKGKFFDSEEDYLRLDPRLKPVEGEHSYLVNQVYVTVAEPKPGDGLSDLDRLENALQSLHSGAFHIPLNVMIKLPAVLRENGGEVIVYYYIAENLPHITNTIPANRAEVTYGIAIDVGTTTIAVLLADEAGNIAASRTAYNRQIECGLDVISRINYAKKEGHLAVLRERVLDSVNVLIQSLCEGHGISPEQIINASLAGNTTMTQLLLGIEPEYIRLAPYTPTLFRVPRWTAADIGLRIAPNTPVDMAPAIGSYVGGDILSGMLCTPLAADSEALSLFIDIGTNGEMVLGNSEFLLSCACSAGPAFEGGGIRCGMRASGGAVERVQIDPLTKELAVSVIGGGEPAGICGSGMISLIAELFRAGLIDAAGKLIRGGSDRITVQGKTASFTLAETDGRVIAVTEADIENLIRAKAAVFSACCVMLKQVGLTFSDLERVYIAGGFGRYLDNEDAKTIGLLPNLPPEKYGFLGNASLMGAYMTLLSRRHRETRRALAAKTTYLDLSAEPGYMDEYMAALFLPHTDGTLFQ